MKEKDFVTIINNSFKAAGGFSYKIPDSPFIPGHPKMRFTGKKPLDIVSQLNYITWFIEVKFSRGICGFNEKIFRLHQLENLFLIENNRPAHTVKPVMIYGCYIPRQVKRIYIFHIHLFKTGQFKMTKKELLQLPYIQITKKEYKKWSDKEKRFKTFKEDLFDATKMEEYIIK